MSDGAETTQRLNELALKYARQYAGKIEIATKVPVRELNDFSVWYTPGVAAVSRAIHQNPDLSFELTSRWNSIAVVTDGSRVLGLSNVGPHAAMPVMEGKALIYKYLGGVDAVPIPLATQNQDEIIETVKRLEPAFGGINLEDIESPKCFNILDKLRSEMSIPVWHDDQQGTAGAILAALFNALKLTGRDIGKTRIALVGAGAANIATARLLFKAGADPGEILMVDSRGTLHPEREDIDELMLRNPWKYEMAIKTNRDRIRGGMSAAIEGADILVSASKPGPGIIKKDQIRTMNKNAVVFLLANPVPEMWPNEAVEAGAKVVATGRSDFPNQVNNSNVFPCIFRGALDARAKTISDTMVITASKEIAEFAEEKGIHEQYIVPTMEEWEVFPRVAATTAAQAVAEGLARKKLSRDEFYENAKFMIQRARNITKTMMEQGFIKQLQP